ncbi:hypothetical protein F4802DRAFT_598308 [Xylaria palmicola]|nr:hypothetical protein F4802DRAFT_598308 [Xylaria palmicola]
MPVVAVIVVAVIIVAVTISHSRSHNQEQSYQQSVVFYYSTAMDHATALILDSGVVASMGGVAAATSVARRRGVQGWHHDSPRSNPNPLDTAGYMNHLRAPPPSRIPASRGGAGLTKDMEEYKTARRQLRETYIWNLRELYYVGRVREVYDNHCHHHRLLFQDVYLRWEMPARLTLREEGAISTSRAPTPHLRRSSGSLRTRQSSSSPVPTPRPRRESENEQSPESRQKGKGKEKEAIASGDAVVDTPPRTADVDSNARPEYIKTSPTSTHNESADVNSNTRPEYIDDTKTSPTGTHNESAPAFPQKPSKLSIHQRFRQLWPSKSRGGSIDKTELVPAIRKDDHEYDEDRDQ